MTALLYTLGVRALRRRRSLVSIGLHELGHMIPAKTFGGKVTQYFIGFGPTVWSHAGAARPSTASRRSRSAATSRSSGCCRRAEQLATSPTTPRATRRQVRKSNTGMFTQLISDARAAEWEHVEPGDDRPALLPACRGGRRSS